MIDHIVRLVEAKAAEIEAASAEPQVVAANRSVLRSGLEVLT